MILIFYYDILCILTDILWYTVMWWYSIAMSNYQRIEPRFTTGLPWYYGTLSCNIRTLCCMVVDSLQLVYGLGFHLTWNLFGLCPSLAGSDPLIALFARHPKYVQLAVLALSSQLSPSCHTNVPTLLGASPKHSSVNHLVGANLTITRTCCRGKSTVTSGEWMVGSSYTSHQIYHQTNTLW